MHAQKSPAFLTNRTFAPATTLQDPTHIQSIKIMDERHSLSEPRPVPDLKLPTWEVDICREGVPVLTLTLDAVSLPPRCNKKKKGERLMNTDCCYRLLMPTTLIPTTADINYSGMMDTDYC